MNACQVETERVSQQLSWLSLWCSARWFWLVTRNAAGTMTQSDSAKWVKIGQASMCSRYAEDSCTRVMHECMPACHEFLFWTWSFSRRALKITVVSSTTSTVLLGTLLTYR
jgi:hypothetical protein